MTVCYLKFKPAHFSNSNTEYIGIYTPISPTISAGASAGDLGRRSRPISADLGRSRRASRPAISADLGRRSRRAFRREFRRREFPIHGTSANFRHAKIAANFRKISDTQKLRRISEKFPTRKNCGEFPENFRHANFRLKNFTGLHK